MPSGLAALNSLELWPLSRAVPHRRLSGWGFQLEGRMLFDCPEPPAPQPACTLIDQPALLQAWRDQALQLPGVTMIEATVTELLWEQACVRGVRLADGRELSSELVVACDGRHSLLRRRAGLPCPSTATPLSLLWFLLQGAAADAIAHALNGRFLTVIAGGGSYALYARAAGGVQLGWLEPPGGNLPGLPGWAADAAAAPAGDWPRRWASAAAEPLASLLAAVPAAAIEGPRRLALTVGCADPWQRPGLLLLGDAAHPLSPLRAQGLNMALRDVLVATEHLVPCLQRPGWAGLETALQRIGCERQQEIRPIQALQQREARLARLLQRLPWLRHGLAAGAGRLGPLLQRRWWALQQPLRHGVLPLTLRV